MKTVSFYPDGPLAKSPDIHLHPEIETPDEIAESVGNHAARFLPSFTFETIYDPVLNFGSIWINKEPVGFFKVTQQ